MFGPDHAKGLKVVNNGRHIITLPYHPEPLSRDTDPRTSMAAAASMRSAAHTQRVAIVELLHARGAYGATANEVDTHYGWRDGTAGRRMRELRELGKVEVLTERIPARHAPPGEEFDPVVPVTRPTTSGRQAEVMCLPMYAPPVRRV